MRYALICAGAVLVVDHEVAQAEPKAAQLECKASGGRLKGLRLEGRLPGAGDPKSFDLTLEANGKRLRMGDTADEAFVTGSILPHRALSLVVRRKDGRHLQLFAVPKTVRLKKRGSKRSTATFRAVLQQAPKPWHTGPAGPHGLLWNLKLDCRHDSSGS